MYTPMINTLVGYISRDPHGELLVNTSLGLVPFLIHNLPYNATYSSETPYLPRKHLGSLLEELSQNLTISLMSVSSLLVTTTKMVSCHKTTTETTWKVDWLPIIVAYSIGLGVALICLILGTYVLIISGVAHDTSFSSIVRTTRNRELDFMIDPADNGALPMSRQMEKQRLRFVDGRLGGLGNGSVVASRVGFVLAT